MQDISRTAQKFIDVCEISGIAFKLSGSNGMRIKECPHCGDKQWKAWIYTMEDARGGACAKCGVKYSFRGFLLACGVDKDTVDAHLQPQSTSLNLEEEEVEESDDGGTVEPVTVVIPPLWAYISEMPNHPASLYAKQRGVPESLYDKIMISPASNSVAFLCHDFEGNLVGYQVRFVDTPIKGPKVSTMKDFKTHENILLYVKEGKPLVVCEGPFDAVSAYVLGYSAACCFGSSMGRGQMDLINRAMGMCKAPFLIAGLDMDDAGKKAKSKLLGYCEDKGLPVKVGYPETGKDLNESLMAGKGIFLADEKPEMFLSSLI